MDRTKISISTFVHSHNAHWGDIILFSEKKDPQNVC